LFLLLWSFLYHSTSVMFTPVVLAGGGLGHTRILRSSPIGPCVYTAYSLWAMSPQPVQKSMEMWPTAKLTPNWRPWTDVFGRWYVFNTYWWGFPGPHSHLGTTSWSLKFMEAMWEALLLTFFPHVTQYPATIIPWYEEKSTLNEWNNESMNEWINEQTNESMNQGRNQWMNE